MLRRVADSLFWAGRHLERAEWRARLVDVNYRLLIESSVPTDPPWAPLLAIAGEEAAFAARHDTLEELAVVDFFVFDSKNPASIRSCIAAARENARTLRHTISSELWLDLNTLYLDSQRWSLRDLETQGLVSFFSDLRDRFYRLTGVAYGTLPRDMGFDFLSLGTMLERADNATRMLDVKYHVLLPSVDEVGGPIDLLQWAAVLRSASGLEAYRKVHGNAIRIDRVVGLLLFDPTFPRSVCFCLDRAQRALERIGDHEAPLAAAKRARARFERSSARDAITSGLHEFLAAVQEDATEVSSAVFDAYLRFE